MRRKASIRDCKQAGLPILPKTLAYGDSNLEMDILEIEGVYRIYVPEPLKEKLLCTPSRIKAEAGRRLLSTDTP